MKCNERIQIPVDRPDEADLQMTILALSGIFWALDLFILEGAADEIAQKQERENGIANLIVAGQRLTKEVSRRF